MRTVRNEALIQQTMGLLNQEAPQQPLSVTVSVPKSSADSVVMREAATRTRVSSIRQEEPRATGCLIKAILAQRSTGSCRFFVQFSLF